MPVSIAVTGKVPGNDVTKEKKNVIFWPFWHYSNKDTAISNFLICVCSFSRGHYGHANTWLVVLFIVFQGSSKLSPNRSRLRLLLDASLIILGYFATASSKPTVFVQCSMIIKDACFVAVGLSVRSMTETVELNWSFKPVACETFFAYALFYEALVKPRPHRISPCHQHSPSLAPCSSSRF